MKSALNYNQSHRHPRRLGAAGSWPLLLLFCWSFRLAAITDDNQLPLDEPLIMEMRLQNLVLNEALLAYPYSGALLLPLGEVSAALDFEITVYPDEGRAEGWFIREARRFNLDLDAGQIRVNGEQHSFLAAQIRREFDDLYIDSRLLAQWFPVEFNFNLSLLRINIEALEKLPLIERLEREKLHQSLGQGRGAPPDYPYQPDPHRWLDWPALDLTVNSGYQGGDNVEGTLDYNYSAQLSGDLLKMNGSLFLRGSDSGGLESARFRLTQKVAGGNAWGLTEVELGDTYTPELEAVTSSRGGRGISVSNYPLYSVSEFDRTTLRGKLLSGWDVEIYRNEVLLNAQSSRGDGRYEFIDVPVLYGNNQLRLVFHGPQGQLREETQHFYVGRQQLRPGEIRYRAGVNQQGRDLIDLAEQGEVAPGTGELRSTLRAEWGLSRDWSLALGYASLPGFDEAAVRRDYYILGFNTAVLGAFSQFNYIGDTNQGAAVQFRTQTQYRDINLGFGHIRFSDFTSERYNRTGQKLARRSAFRLDMTIPDSFIPRLPLSYDVAESVLESGERELNISQRISLNLPGVMTTHTLKYHKQREQDAFTTGTLSLSGYFASWNARFNVGHRLGNPSGVTGYNLTVNLRTGQYSGIRIDAQHQVEADLTSLNLSVNHEFENVFAGIEGSYNTEGDFFIGASFSISLGREPRSGRMLFKPRNLAAEGAVSARVYLDNNNNAVFDDLDEPLPGISFRAGNNAQMTDEQGQLVLTDVYAYRPNNIELTTSQLSDPYWVPTRKGVEVIPRPGRIIEVDFPIVNVGEIDGVVTLENGTNVREVANVELDLINSNGEVAASVKSSYDGFYLFDRVAPGEYKLRMNSAQIDRLKLKIPKPVVIHMSGGEVFSGINIKLQRKALAQPAKPQQLKDKAILKPPATDPIKITRSNMVPPYRIQTGYFKNEIYARKQIDYLAGKGYQAKMAEMVPDAGTARYKVYVGAYTGANLAAAALKQLNKDTGLDAYIVPND